MNAIFDIVMIGIAVYLVKMFLAKITLVYTDL